MGLILAQNEREPEPEADSEAVQPVATPNALSAWSRNSQANEERRRNAERRRTAFGNYHDTQYCIC